MKYLRRNRRDISITMAESASQSFGANTDMQFEDY